MKFRKDINGLRAIAVVGVVIFHFNESWLPGGFAGVDIFFVISGFLMTGIIFKEIEYDEFSLLKFYISRINRLIPALAALLSILLILGYFFLEPIDYRILGKHVGSSISFLSNIVYWSEDGYFDVSSNEKWLLHTWSLSVEWQFYIIYPLMLVIARRFFSILVLKRIVLWGSILGLLFSIIATYQWPSSSYFFLTTRAWEMLVGGVCYLYPIHFLNSTNQQKKLVEMAGILLILVTYFTMESSIAWPGYLAVIPVLGSFLLIQAQRDESFITSNRISQKLGFWSYSIYLWHWPIVVAIYFYSLNNLFIYIGIVFTIIIGFISYKYIEKNSFIINFELYKNYFKYEKIYMILIIGGAGSIIFLTDGLNFDAKNGRKLLNENALVAISDWSYPTPNLKIGTNEIRFIKGSSDKNILFIGASHVEQTYPYVAQLNSDYNIYYLTQGGCFVTPSFEPNLNCSNIKNYKDIISKIDFEIVVTSLFVIDTYLSDKDSLKEKQFQLRVSEFISFLSFLENKTKKIFILLGEPKGDEFNPTLSVRHRLKDYIKTEYVRSTYATQYRVLPHLKKIHNVTIIDPIKYLCSDVCMVRDENLRYYYKDSDHMRPWYAKKSLDYLNQIFR